MAGAALPLLLAMPFAACGNDDQDAFDGDDGVVRGTTPEDYPDVEPGDDPLADDLNEVVRRHLEVDFAQRDWLDDLEEIERDENVVTVRLDRDFQKAPQDFDEVCTAITGFLSSTDVYQVEEIQVEDESGEVVMRSRPESPQCDPVAG